MICKICNFSHDDLKKFSNHLKKDHKLTSKEYTIEYLLNGEAPTCPVCGETPRYCTFKYKKYCINHSNIAESFGGKVGGHAAAWNKGIKQKDDTRIASFAGEKNNFYGKKHSEESRLKISQSKRVKNQDVLNRIEERRSDFFLITPVESYVSRQNQYLDFQCIKCKNINKKTLQAFERGSLCEFCFPNTTSKQSIEIFDWLKSINVSTDLNNRSEISPKEIDIFIPDKNIGIEYDGLYWHSELSPKEISKFSHIDKTKKCLEKGISLIHVFSDDWHNKKDIVKSIILHKAGINQTKIDARKCKVSVISTKEKEMFFNQNHISGDTKSKITWGLFHNDLLVAAISARSPFQKKWEERLEIARFATLKNTHIPGGLSKLLKHVIIYATEQHYKGLLSYSDRRFGEGTGYQKVGFSYFSETGVDYWYTDGQIRINRQNFMSDETKTEKQKAKEMFLGRIWGCGSNIWLYDFKIDV